MAWFYYNFPQNIKKKNHLFPAGIFVLQGYKLALSLVSEGGTSAWSDALAPCP